MNFINTTQAYVRPAAKTTLLQQLCNLGTFDLPGGPALWKMAGKAALLMLPLVLAVNLFIASSITSIDHKLTAMDNQRHELMDKNIEMLARKARLWAPENVREMAADKLSLYTGSEKQVGKFSRRKGTFIYL
ncbi:MAG: hypothetical protein ACN4GW_04915 [Desulforhopalus sp.]